MATINSQSIHSLGNNSLPIPSKQKNWINFITGAISVIMHEQEGKSLSEIIDALYGKLAAIDILTLSEPDQNGNIIATLGDDIRLALALGITNTRANEILLFGRKKGEQNFDASGNKNPNLDLIVAAKAILSKGSILHKAGRSYLEQVLHNLSFTGKFAYEQTDGDGDAQHIIMPVFSAETQSIVEIPSDKAIQVLSIPDLSRMSGDILTAKGEIYKHHVSKTYSNLDLES